MLQPGAARQAAPIVIRNYGRDRAAPVRLRGGRVVDPARRDAQASQS